MVSSPCVYHHHAQHTCEWRPGDDLVLGSGEGWLECLQNCTAKVMILKRRPNTVGTSCHTPHEPQRESAEAHQPNQSASKQQGHMSNPTTGAWNSLIHTWTRPLDPKVPIFSRRARADFYTDSDWAQDCDRKSVSCIVHRDGHPLPTRASCNASATRNYHLVQLNSLPKTMEPQSEWACDQ